MRDAVARGRFDTPSGLQWAVIILAALVLASAGGGCKAKKPQRPAFYENRDYTREDVLRFLRAAPVLYPSITRYKRLIGEGDSIERLKVLDEEAGKFGYAAYSEFAAAYTRLTNAVTYIRLLEKGGVDATIGGGGDIQQPLKKDIPLVKPYMDDIERVVGEARSASARGEGG